MRKLSLLIVHLFVFTCLGYAQTVTIGDQVWMTKNLNVDTFRNGDRIPEAKTEGEWKAYAQADEAAWCYYDNDPNNGEKYGKLYNWHAVNDPRGLAPNGMHIPNDEDWTQLINFLGGIEKAGVKMKSKSGWMNDGVGTNSSGFLGFPGGGRNLLGGFYDIGKRGSWWTSTESTWYYGSYIFLYYEYGKVFKDGHGKAYGFSVRCIKD